MHGAAEHALLIQLVHCAADLQRRRDRLPCRVLADKQRQNATIALKKAVELAGDKPIGKAAKEKLDALAKKK